jgi:hypothetical protein
MPPYIWSCHVCSNSNVAGAEHCAKCGNAAVLSANDIERIKSRLGHEPDRFSTMRFPNLFRRYLASIIDALTIIFIVYAYSRTPLYVSGEEPLFVMLLAVTYEPVLTAFSCTLGQAAMRFRVRRVKDLTRISLAQAYARVILKYTLGTRFVLSRRSVKRRSTWPAFSESCRRSRRPMWSASPDRVAAPLAQR